MASHRPKRNAAVQHQALWKDAVLFRSLLAPESDQQRASDFFICSIGSHGEQQPSQFSLSPPPSPSVKSTFPALSSPLEAAPSSHSSSNSPWAQRPPAHKHNNVSGNKNNNNDDDDDDSCNQSSLDLGCPLPPPMCDRITMPPMSNNSCSSGSSGGNKRENSSEPLSPSKEKKFVSLHQDPAAAAAAAAANVTFFSFFVGKKDSVSMTRATRPPFHTKTATPLCPHFFPLAAADLKKEPCALGSRCDYLHPSFSAALKPVPPLALLAAQMKDDAGEITVQKDRRLYRVAIADCEPTAGLLLLSFLLVEGAILTGALRVCQYHMKPGGCRHKSLCLYAHLMKPQLLNRANLQQQQQKVGGSTTGAVSGSTSNIASSIGSPAVGNATGIFGNGSNSSAAACAFASASNSGLGASGGAGGGGGEASSFAAGAASGTAAAGSSSSAAAAAASATSVDKIEANTPLSVILAMALPASCVPPVAKWWSDIGVKNVGDAQGMSKDIFSSMTQTFFAKAFVSTTGSVAGAENNKAPQKNDSFGGAAAGILVPVSAASANAAGNGSDSGSVVTPQHRANCLLALESLRVLPYSTPIDVALKTFHAVTHESISRFSLAHPKIATVGDLARVRLKSLLFPHHPDRMLPVQVLSVLEQLRSRLLQDDEGPKSVRIGKCGFTYRILTDIVVSFREVHAHHSWRKGDARRPVVTSAITFVDVGKCRCAPYDSVSENNNGGSSSSSNSASHNVKQQFAAQQQREFPSEPIPVPSSGRMIDDDSSSSAMLAVASGGGSSEAAAGARENSNGGGFLAASNRTGSGEPQHVTNRNAINEYPPFSASGGVFSLPGPPLSWCQCPRAYEIAVNYELSTPAGSRCSEQNTLGKVAASGYPTCALREVFVHGQGVTSDDGKVDDPNPLFVCGVCESSLRRISKDIMHRFGGDVSLIMFDRMDAPRRLMMMPMHEISHRASSHFKKFVDENLRGEEVDMDDDYM